MTDPYQPYQPSNPTPPPPDPYQPPMPPMSAPMPPDPYAQPAYYQPSAYPYGYQPPRETEGLAIASLVVSCAAVLGICLYGFGALLGIVGAILGHVARSRIKHNGNNGAGMALAGIIVGWTISGIAVAAIAAIVIYGVAGGGFS
ncbi:hypothetical protein GCM10010172_25780 [Paractinoplanes ferrugineus]|uniref:DUF4190 domain-containing protein n=1 Tax=Paractinoplanes ferrugineus TaxID=113564 RepID=A0A919IVD4_9ACTN|nr:DUF4190 domain-containing protein [Actinoplanes ferrugineus]GIE08512.1 hypothetical protein Afe05nite_03520 [Actinoplanes ferrugineus]